MTLLWASLAPFILASALMPGKLVIVLSLLGSPGRVRTAGAAVGGTILVRLLQGLVFGMILHWGSRDHSKNGQGWIVPSILLVVAVLLIVTAIRELMGGDDPDDPPPKWMAALSSMTPPIAFLLGAGVILVSVKMWIFTFAAIGLIGDAGMTRPANVVTYVIFVLLSVGTHLAIVFAAAVFPTRSEVLLNRALGWLRAHNRIMMIVIGFGFGGWFLYKGLHGFGIL